MSEVRWENLRSNEISTALDRGAAVLIPFGTLEEHGEHLPAGTDLIQAYHVLLEVAARTDSLVLPPIYYGQSHSTFGYMGSVLISSGTLYSLARDILSSLIGKGVKRIMLSSGHAGSIHLASIRDAAYGASRENPDVKIWVVSDYDVAKPAAAQRGDFCKEDAHGGDIETSRMLDIAPSLVSKHLPGLNRSFAKVDPLPVDGRHYLDKGYGGDPSMATAEKGRFLNERVVERLVAMLTEG